MTILIYYRSILLDRDVLFEPTNLCLILYIYIIKSSIDTILIRNKSAKPIRVYKKTRLRYITKIPYNNYFLVKDNIKIRSLLVSRLLATKIY